MHELTIDDHRGNGRNTEACNTITGDLLGSDGGGRNGGVRDTADPSEAPEQLVSLLPLLAGYEELDVETIGYHARQSDATARDGYWHAAINEARSFLEALVTGIALVEREQSLTEFRKAQGMQGGIKLCRRYLLDVGFLDIDEDVLLAHVYGIASAKGSHLGVADEAWCRLARRIVRTTVEYILHRYAAWRTTDRRKPSTDRASRSTEHASHSNGYRNGSDRSTVPKPWPDHLAAFLRRAAARKPNAAA